MSPTPIVVFFAFANDRVERARYLRNLPEEQRRVRDAMATAEEAGLCGIVERANATMDEVLDVFQDSRYRDRVAVFHFGGHAGGAALLLESATGVATVAHAGGLARFLGHQRGLELVFLNGCSSRGQVQGLLDAGVPAVIATSQAIDDGVATELSTRFYKALASGAPIRTAFAEAQEAVRTRRGDFARGTYRSFVPEEVAEDLWPWDLYVAPGAEERVARWSLPLAARDPLFGLPAPPAMDLPLSPFKHLDWFTREDAEVFFGRGQEIRDLYKAVTAPNEAPIVLLFGATGVGKSSLLAAGLTPRLEASHEVAYMRRGGVRGLTGTLIDALQSAGHAAETFGDDFGAAWRAREEATGKPLVVILDQVEEAWIRPLNSGREAEDLAVALRSIFAIQENRPRGRLILSFRKEWLAEVLRLVDAEALPRFRVEVTHLGRDAIAEIVAGPQSSERLKRHYSLEVTPELPGIVADDLLEDPGAAIAPALQILLTKMWALAARGHDAEPPRFTVELYQQLKRKGILLDDFLEEQLSELADWRRELVESGLALDLLAHHTTPMSTAETRQAAEVVELYGGRQDVIELLQQCMDRYLLTGTARMRQRELVGDSGNRLDQGTTRLAHDTLAPLVRRRFEDSDLPGQRARHVLEHRAPEWADDKEGPPLDEVDLTLVEQGADGMRAWTADEKRLVESSQKDRERRRRQEQNLRWAGIVVVLLIAAAAAVAWWQRARAEEEALTAGRVTDFLQNMFRELDPRQVALDKNTLPRILERSRKRIETDLAGEPEAQNQLRETLGTVYLNLGLLKQAEDLLHQVVTFRRRVSGDEHPDTLGSMHKLAHVFYQQGRLQKGEDLQRQVLEIRRRVLGTEHPETLASMHHLASVYSARGSLDAAKDLYRQTLEVRRRVLGAEHLDTLKSMNNLAGVYYAQGLLSTGQHKYQPVIFSPCAVNSSVREERTGAEKKPLYDRVDGRRTHSARATGASLYAAV